MEQMNHNICRLCLKFGDDTFSDFSDLSSKDKLKTVLPGLNVDNPKDFVICSRCRTSLDEYYQFIQTFNKNDDFIRSEKNRLKIVNKINLNRIIKFDSGEKRDMNRNVCRICFNTKAAKYTGLNKANLNKWFCIVLETFLPKLDHDLSGNPLMCLYCLETLREMYEFKTNCMIVEQMMVQYSKTSSQKQIDLNKVLDSLNRQKLKKGVTSHSQNTDTNKKRPLSKEESDAVPSKKQKSSKEDNNTAAGQIAPTSEGSKDMPPFNFRYNLLYEAVCISKLEEWLSRVDILKKKNNWTDLMTINKVLEKLKDLSEIYPFLSNIAKVFKWEEWKNKLIAVFPNRNDYGTLLRRMVNRKKRPNETFVNYYDVKMEILTAMNITGEEAISCLLGGISDVIVICVGRVGNYKKPEDLRLYFEICDNKKKANSELQNHEKEKDTVQKSHKANGKPANTSINSQKQTEQSSSATTIRGKENKDASSVSERQNHEKGKDIVQKSQSEKANRKPANTSANFQKQTEQSLSTTTIRGKENRDASSVKPQEKVLLINSSSSTSQKRKMEANLSDKELSGNETSTATPPKLGTYMDRVSKQDQSDGKGARGPTTEKQSKQSDGDACFAKPQPPTRKSTPLSAVSQSKGSGLNKSQTQKAISTGSTPTTKQSEGSNKRDTYSSSQKPQNKENEVVSSSATTQVQSKHRRETSSTMPRAHDEKSDRDTSATNHKEQRKENSNSNVRSSRPQDRSEERDALQAQSKRYEFVNFVKPQASVGGGSSTRGTSGQQKEVDYKTRDYSSRGNSATAVQDWRRESYSSRGISSTGSKRDREEDYVNRSTSASTLQDRRDGGYYSRGTSDVRSQEYIEESYLDGRSQLHIEESNINRAQSDIDRSRSSIRPRVEKDVGYVNVDMSDVRSEEQIEEYYSSRDLLSKRFEEPIERGAQEERDNGYNKRHTYVRPEEQGVGGYSRRDLSSEKFREHVARDASSARPQEERDVGYSRRGASARSEAQSTGSYSRRDLSSDRFQGRVEQDGSSARPREERDVGYSRSGASARSKEQSTGSYSTRDLSNERFQERVEQDGSSARPREERDVGYSRRGAFARSEEQSTRSYSRRDLLGERFQEPEERDASIVRPREEREIGYAEKYRWEIEADNINRSIPSDRRRENDMHNKGTLSTRSPVQEEGNRVNRKILGARSEEVWESSYVDRGVTNVRREGRDEEDINKGEVNVRRPEDKGMEGRGFRAVELMDRSYLNRDAPTSRPGDGSYLNKVAAPTSPREFKDGSYVNRSTLPSERMSGRSDESYLNRSTLPREGMPARSDGSYFNKSISSTRLLGSGLGSLFSLSLASRPFTSYPSSAITAKPLDASYFNRGLSQKQSHREMCTRCYTIGHNSVDCPRFRTT